MAELVDGIGLTGDTTLDDLTHAAEIAIEKVDVISIDKQPAPTIHRRSPCADRRHQSLQVTIIEFARSFGQFGNRERMRTVVRESEVDVGIGARRSTRPRTAERHRFDSLDQAQPRRDPRADSGNVGWYFLHDPDARAKEA